MALLGPVGSGKTTVLNLLPRFYDVTDGRVTIDGVDIRDVTLDSLRANVGVVMQDVFLFNGTIRDNIAYGRPDATDEEIIEAAKIARLHDFIMTLPDGYDTWVGERGITLSGGQKQRIAIARTLLLDPKILVLDDSTSSVDMETEYLIQQALAALLKGRTAFVIAHRLRTVRNADQILVLEDGAIVEQGTHDELLALGGLYREIYDVQLRDQEESTKTGAGQLAADRDGGPGSMGDGAGAVVGGHGGMAWAAGGMDGHAPGRPRLQRRGPRQGLRLAPDEAAVRLHPAVQEARLLRPARHARAAGDDDRAAVPARPRLRQDPRATTATGLFLHRRAVPGRSAVINWFATFQQSYQMTRVGQYALYDVASTCSATSPSCR